MALILLEGFDHYDDGPELAKKGFGLTGTPLIGTSYGRNGSGGVLIDADELLSWTPPVDTHTSIWSGFAIYKNTTAAPSLSAANGIFRQWDTAGRVNIVVLIDATYNFRVYRVDISTTLIGTGTFSFPNLTWVWVELYIKLHETTGEVVLKVNGNVDINLTSQDTIGYYSNEYIGPLQLGSIHYSQETWFDDWYVDDSEFVGEIKVVTSLPDSDGSHTDFTPLGAGSHYVEVDETYPDDDTSYIQGSEVGDKDSFGVPSTGVSGDIVGVQVSQYAKKTAEKIVGIKNLVRVGGSDYLGDEQFLGQDYGFHKDLWLLNPDTSTPWTKSSIDNAEFGLELTSISTTTTTTT